MITPTENEIIQGAEAAGLLPYLVGLRNGYSLSNDREFIQRVAGLVASGKVDLRMDADSDRMATMEDWAFFAGQSVLLRLIPELDVDYREMMDLVSMLVRRGGEDGAATLPNRSFVQWCARDGLRVDSVLKDARNGVPLATDHLLFALEAGGRVDEAIDFLNSNGSQQAASAAAALGRMKLDLETGARSLAALSEIAARTDDEMVLHHAVRSCYAIVGQDANLDREHARTALAVAAECDCPEARHAVAHVLADHGEELSGEETKVALRALEATEPKYAGTINLIDLASSKLSTAEKFTELTSLVTKLIKDSNGGVTLDVFPLYREATVGDDGQLRSLIVGCLLDGDPGLCETVTSTLNKIRREPLVLELGPEHIPASSADQMVVCRRAVGFLFVAPITAASIAVSMLQHGGAEVRDEAAHLLYDPLLVNFGGGLRSYLQDVAERNIGTFGMRIQEALDRAEPVAALEGLPPMPELHPSEQCRHTYRLSHDRAMRRLMREGARQSIMRQVMEESTLLYGNASTVYVEDPENGQGGLRRIDVPMMSHSVSMEVPRLSVFDPEGLEQLLWLLKSGRRSSS